MAASDRARIRALVVGLERVTERVVTKIALDVTANLVETTPVDIGWARVNWVPAIGSPLIVDLPGAARTPEGVASAIIEQASAVAALATGGYRLKQGSVFVSNNVSYITKLNEGSSQQQPAAFVQRAIAKAVTQDIRGLAS